MKPVKGGHAEKIGSSAGLSLSGIKRKTQSFLGPDSPFGKREPMGHDDIVNSLGEDYSHIQD